MNGLVLDNSITMAWCFEDETTPYSESVLNYLAGGGTASVPSIWPYEVANVLAVAERRKRITHNKVAIFVKEIQAFNIAVYQNSTDTVLGEVLTIARAWGLTSYDAAYLELCVRERLPLASLDAKLRDAAMGANIALYV